MECTFVLYVSVNELLWLYLDIGDADVIEKPLIKMKANCAYTTFIKHFSRISA